MDKSDAGEVSAVEWWAAREDRMPTLAPLAALYLHLPTTSVDAERLFSHYSALLTEHRRSLTEENVKMMLIAKFTKHQILTHIYIPTLLAFSSFSDVNNVNNFFLM